MPRHLTNRWRGGSLGARLLRNSSMLLGGNFFSSLLNLASLVIAARVLGTDLFGRLVLIVTYVQMMDKLFKFQSWQALIKYGADCLSGNSRPEFRRLVKFGLVLDVASGAIGTIAAVGAALVASRWMEWAPETVWFLCTYSLLILFNINGTPIAVLRLFDRFRWLAIQSVASSTLRVVGAVVAASLAGDLKAFLSIWFVSQLAGYVLLVAAGYAALRAEGLAAIWSEPIAGIRRRHVGLLSFVWTTNIQSSVRLGTTELDTLVVGGILGPAGAGSYNVMKRVSQVLSLMSAPLSYALYPELAKLWSARSLVAFNRLLARSSIAFAILGLLVWAGFIVFGRWALDLTVGPQFSNTYDPTVIYMFAVLLATATCALYPAMLAMGRPNETFLILCAATTVYLPSLYVLTREYGLSGAAASFVIFYCVWASAMVSRTLTWARRSSGHERIPGEKRA